MDDFDVAQLRGSLHERVDESGRGGRAAVKIDAMARLDPGDRLFRGDELHECEDSARRCSRPPVS
jgi:hypothetical protein